MAQKETIRIRSARPTDRFNDPIGPVPAWRDVPGATVVPRESQDYEQRGPIIIVGFMIRVGPTVVVVDTDEVEVRGEVYQIEGAVADYLRKGKIFYVTRAS